MTLVPIGWLSHESGVKIPTIRYYENIGLLPPPVRSESNRRMYPPEMAQRLRFIRHARQLGFDVEAIRRLADLALKPTTPCGEAHTIACARLRDIEDKIARLVAQRAEVLHMINTCAQGCIEKCGVIEILEDHTKCLHESH
ncbi:MAG: helix-turn-helix domain-containing protein [Rhodospirillaceae bacterium]|nr:helix-turn-helix domain-containing protein [Rhodospirillaceae bacterium]